MRQEISKNASAHRSRFRASIAGLPSLEGFENQAIEYGENVTKNGVGTSRYPKPPTYRPHGTYALTKVEKSGRSG